MPRKRDLSPTLFTNEELFAAERASGLPLRLAYAGLWTVCDRDGRFEWRARLKLDVLPYDAVDFLQVLDAFEAHRFVISYVVRGTRYGWCPTFRVHQRLHPREAPSKIPAPPDETVTRAREYWPEGVMAKALEPWVGKRTAEGKPRARLRRSKVPQAVQDLSGRSGPSSPSGPSGPSDGDTAAARAGLPAEYHADFDATLRRSHVPDAFAREVAVLLRGTHPDATGATAAEVGMALRELALAGAAASKLGVFVRTVIRRRTQDGVGADDFDAAKRRLQAKESVA